MMCSLEGEKKKKAGFRVLLTWDKIPSLPLAGHVADSGLSGTGHGPGVRKCPVNPWEDMHRIGTQ